MSKSIAIVSFLVMAEAAFLEAAEAITFENSNFRYTISAEAKNAEFVDRVAGVDYLRAGASPCAFIRKGGREQAATRAHSADGRLSLFFGDEGPRVILKAEMRSFGLVLAVDSVTGGEVDALTFLNVPLKLSGSPDEKFGACALAMNLPTRVDALPALQRDLRASCEKKFGLVGAKVVVVGAPMDRMLSTLQQALTDASELPVCRVAGPWAREVAFNHGSYLFNFGALTETNIGDWIGMARTLGFTQIDNHGGGAFFRFGDMELDRQKWPDGWETWRRIVARLHQDGISSIFHTYAFFIDKRSKYVTPVPDGRLDAFRAFTLAEPLGASATEITVNESTAAMTTVTGFFEHNSILLHIGDELVTFGGVSKQAPWRFTGVKRGALGTKAAAHDRGAKARHLKECFGLLVPNPESSLFEEIAANHAEVVNSCNFDGVYLDAIDGSSILRGGDECWYWANKFVVAIQKRLKKPVGMEMSAMWHHFWQYRTRWQAWDYPQRGHQRFIDLHAESVNGGLLLPLHLGWWSFQSFNPPQVEPSYPDVMENLGAKLIGWDAGISLTAGVDRDTLRRTPLFRRAVDILRGCEEMRHANLFDEATKAKLRESGKEFALFKDAAGKTRFRRVLSQSRTFPTAESWPEIWGVTNSFAEQPARFRIAALMSVATQNDSNQGQLQDFFRMKELAACRRSSADGVAVEFVPASTGENPLCSLVASNSGKVARNAAWVKIEKRFDPPLNLQEYQGLRMMIRNENSEAVVAFRQESPQHLAFGAIADRYVTVESGSGSYYTLVETESSRWSDFVWNDGKGLYNVYRETINFAAVDSISVWLQNLAPNQETKVDISHLQAIPLRSSKVKNPRIIWDGKIVQFPVELASGSWIECNGMDDCAVYGSKGEPLGRVTPSGDWPILRQGITPLNFSCDENDGPKPRAGITIFTQGEAL